MKLSIKCHMSRKNTRDIISNTKIKRSEQIKHTCFVAQFELPVSILHCFTHQRMIITQ